jgi:hypothetical protein
MKNLLFAPLAVLLLTPAIFADETCPPEGISLLPHQDCTKYIVCDEGLQSLMNCPPNLFFNTEELVCDFPRNVPECVGGTRPPRPTTTQIPSTTTTTTTPRTTTTTATTTTTVSPDPIILTQCGETVQANNGFIEYKLLENYSANELCSFIIRTETIGDLTFTLESHGFNATADPFAITIFTFSGEGLIETTHLGPPNPLSQTYVQGNIAVVVFKTLGNSGTGFRLSFNAIISNTFYGLTGKDLTYSNLTGGELTIPFWPEPGRNRANIIVLSADNKKVADVFSNLRLTFLKENLQTQLVDVARCGNDAINIYTLAPKAQFLEHEGVFCSLTHHRSVYVTTGIFILVFRDFEESYWSDQQATFKWEVYRS